MDSPSLLSPLEFSGSLKSANPPLLLDVRLEEDYHVAHLTGAKNNCVFEVAFLQRMNDIAPDKNAPVCVYGASDRSFESRMAAEKLARAGYQNVSELREGFAGCQAAALSIEKGKPAEETAVAPADGHLDIDLAESRIEWLGRNLLNKHSGTLAFKSGRLEFAGGQLRGGVLVIDMNSIACVDLAGDRLHDVLVGHLKSDDFFDVALHPEARVEIRAAAPVHGAAAGACNLQVKAALTLKGITRPVEFLASAGLTPEGKPAAQAALAIDRTEWNVLYGSGKFFERLAGHLVNDLIELQLRVITK